MLKTITKFSALAVVVLGLVGCGEDNEKKALSDPVTGKPTGASTAGPNTPRTSEEAMKTMTNPMMSNPNYGKTQKGGK